MFQLNDTIVASATAMASSGIGIIRMSGEDALNILYKIFHPKNENKDIREVATHTIHYGYIFDGEDMIDEVLVMIMKAPHTYTGENTVEIDCHGGIYAMQRVLDAAVKAGARPAEPGEFSKRAFLNGKMDLSKAEAVMDLIHAGSSYALKSSLSQLSGSLERKISEIREKLLHQVAYIESALDDPEHYDIEGFGEELEVIVGEEKKKINHLIASFSEGKMIREGIKTVIIGKPNAGKSSLMNLLVGEKKAIVTDIAGTTRDALEENINIGGVSLRIIDTAGIRDTQDVVEKIGVTMAREHAADADLILYVVDSSIPLDENDREIMDMIRKSMKKTIILFNKTDLESKVDEEGLKAEMNLPVLQISAKTEEGLKELSKTIRSMFFKGEISFNDEVYITNIRHKKALDEAEKSLGLVEESIANGMPEDFYSIDLMGACDSLGSITGENVGEDLVNEIFSKFCTGK